jgi:hypothetical protein
LGFVISDVGFMILKTLSGLGFRPDRTVDTLLFILNLGRFNSSNHLNGASPMSPNQGSKAGPKNKKILNLLPLEPCSLNLEP